MQQRYKIVSLVYEVENEDGSSAELVHLEDYDIPLGYIKFLRLPGTPDQEFYVATSHNGLSGGEFAIGSPLPDVPYDSEKVRSATNTLIGLIRDGNCHVFATYDIPSLSIAK